MYMCICIIFCADLISGCLMSIVFKEMSCNVWMLSSLWFLSSAVFVFSWFWTQPMTQQTKDNITLTTTTKTAAATKSKRCARKPIHSLFVHSYNLCACACIVHGGGDSFSLSFVIVCVSINTRVNDIIPRRDLPSPSLSLWCCCCFLFSSFRALFFDWLIPTTSFDTCCL